MSEITAKANGTKTVIPATDTKANVKNENAKVEAKMPKLEATAEKRIKNLENFSALCKKFSFLKVKSDELNAYNMSRDGLKETLIIENSDGRTFEISNSRIIGKLLIIAQDELLNLLDQSEQEVIKFSI